MDYRDRITALLNKCMRNANKADMHSFTAKTQKGTVYVELEDQRTFYVETTTCEEDGKEHRKAAALPPEHAAITLRNLLIDLSTVEF